MTTYDFESGTVGNAASTANTGASSIVGGGGHTIAIDNVGVVSGAQSLSFSAGNTTAALYCDFAGDPAITTQKSLYIAITLSPDGYNNSGGSTTLWQQFLTGGTTTVFRISVTNAGALTVSDQGTAHTATLVADISSKYGQTIVVRLNLDSGTTSSNGSYTARYYATPGTAVGSPTNTATASNWNLGAGGSFGNFRMGINSTQASLGTGSRKTTYDAVTDAAGLSWIASPAAPTAPTANAGADQYGQAGSTITLSGAGTPGSSGGSINGYAWSLVGKSDSAMATPTITTPAAQTTTLTGLDPGVYTFQLVVSQTGGALSSSPDQVVVWVHPASGQTVKPYSIVKATGITREGAASSDTAALTDADATTLLKWPDPPTGQTVTIRWNPCGPSNPQFTFDMGKVGSGTVNAAINHYLEDGTTLLDGPYPAVLGAVTPVPAGLDADAITALGTALANRRQLVTIITAS